ncbi:hypothetical protein [Anabaena sp. CS-542/02]|nr:hypothetical protein [Anabaena sp. CS-542/02]MDB9445361.1 hypothetical protein [Anabaena sp. CS-542/02]
MLDATITNIVDGVRGYAHPSSGATQDYDPLLTWEMGDPPEAFPSGL